MRCRRFTSTGVVVAFLGCSGSAGHAAAPPGTPTADSGSHIEQPVADELPSPEKAWLPKKCTEAKLIASDSRRLVVARLRGKRTGSFSAPPPFDLEMKTNPHLADYSFKLESVERYELAHRFMAKLTEHSLSGIACPDPATGEVAVEVRMGTSDKLQSMHDLGEVIVKEGDHQVVAYEQTDEIIAVVLSLEK